MAMKWRIFVSLFTIATVIHAAKTKRSHGTFLKVPFDFRSVWNPDDGRIFTPNVFGVGWTVNGYQLAKRLGLLKEHAEEEEDSSHPQ